MKKILSLLIGILCFSTVYAEDMVQVVPFTSTAGGINGTQLDWTKYTNINLYNTKDYVGLQFTICVPSDLMIYMYQGSRFYSVSSGPGGADYKHSVSTSTAQSYSELDGYVYYTVSVTDQKTPNHAFVGNSGDDVLKMYYGIPSTMANGTYKIILKDIKLIVSGTEKVEIPTAESYFVVGDASSKPSITPSGSLSSAVVNTLPAGSTVDLSNVTEISGTSTNSVTVNYTRPTASGNVKWGTVCMPVALTSGNGIQYYSVKSISSDKIEIETMSNVPAGTPAIYNNTGTGDLKISATGKINATAATPASLVGVMKATNVTEANTYYLKDNQFKKINGNFNIGAFKAYLKGGNTAKADALDLEIGSATAINALMGEGDVTIDGIYDVNGAVQSDLQKGVNIVKLSNGKTQKIIVK